MTAYNTWQTHAYRFAETEPVHYREFGEVGYLQLFGYREPIVPVRLVEDPQGDYRGLVAAEDPTSINFVLLAKIFEIQFADGSSAEAAAGHGRVVRLRVEELAEEQVLV